MSGPPTVLVWLLTRVSQLFQKCDLQVEQYLETVRQFQEMVECLDLDHENARLVFPEYFCVLEGEDTPATRAEAKKRKDVKEEMMKCRETHQRMLLVLRENTRHYFFNHQLWNGETEERGWWNAAITRTQDSS